MIYEEVLRRLLNPSIQLDVGFCVINHGCKVNRVEGDTLSTYLVERGARLCDEDDAELVVVNTCTVTGEADKKARKAVRHALKTAPHAAVVVTGCGAAIDPGGYASLDPRVAVVPREELLIATKPAGAIRLRSGADFRTRVNLKIQDGCNHACTYCIVHVARGKAHSEPASSVLAEADRYLSAGTKELVLTGIDLGSYRDGDIKLDGLLECMLALADKRCEAGEPPARVRASSLEPMSISNRFIDLMSRSEGRICRHLHVPLQSGSTKVLREMARPYDAESFRELVEGLYQSIPELSLSTDIIVGFPGETDDDFARTMELARACRFSKIHVFPYSRRAGTPAAARTDQIAPDVIRERAAMLRALSDELRLADRAARVGNRELAIVETRFALTESYHEVAIPEGCRAGELVPIVMASDTIGA